MEEIPRKLTIHDIEVMMDSADHRHEPMPPGVLFRWCDLEAALEVISRKNPSRAKHAKKVMEWVRTEAVKEGYVWADIDHEEGGTHANQRRRLRRRKAFKKGL